MRNWMKWSFLGALVALPALAAATQVAGNLPLCCLF